MAVVFTTAIFYHAMFINHLKSNYNEIVLKHLKLLKHLKHEQCHIDNGL